MQSAEPIYNPLAGQIENLFKFVDSDHKRVGIGIPEIDNLIRGPAPGEICMVMGRSYAGKSIIGQNIVLNNSRIPSIFFSMEMPVNQALIRLYSMWSDTNAAEVQAEIEKGELNSQAWELVTAFPQHWIVDDVGLTVDEMSLKLEEFEAVFRVRPEFVVVDYLELLGGAKRSGEGYLATEAQATMLKDWAKQEDMRVFVLHQTNRQEPRWSPPTEESARNAGFTEADFVIGAWRPHLDPKLDYWEKLEMRSVLRMNVLKNRAFFEEKERIDLHITPSLRIWKGEEFATNISTERTYISDADYESSEEQSWDYPNPYAD